MVAKYPKEKTYTIWANVSLVFFRLTLVLKKFLPLALNFCSSPHKKKAIQKRLAAACQNRRGQQGIAIEISPQPAQSPDLNLCDLGFFASLDTHLGNKRSFDLLKFDRQVKAAFRSYDPNKLDKLADTKMLIIQEIIKCSGSNTYCLPHGERPPRNRQPT